MTVGGAYPDMTTRQVQRLLKAFRAKANVSSLVERVSRFTVFLRNDHGRSNRCPQPLPHAARRSIDKEQRVTHPAITENKRLGEVMIWIKAQQGRRTDFKLAYL